jgi:hypothetical protein
MRVLAAMFKDAGICLGTAISPAPTTTALTHSH